MYTPFAPRRRLRDDSALLSPALNIAAIICDACCACVSSGLLDAPAKDVSSVASTSKKGGEGIYNNIFNKVTMSLKHV